MKWFLIVYALGANPVVQSDVTTFDSYLSCSEALHIENRDPTISRHCTADQQRAYTLTYEYHQYAEWVLVGRESNNVGGTFIGEVDCKLAKDQHTKYFENIVGRDMLCVPASVYDRGAYTSWYHIVFSKSEFYSMIKVDNLKACLEILKSPTEDDAIMTQYCTARPGWIGKAWSGYILEKTTYLDKMDCLLAKLSLDTKETCKKETLEDPSKLIR